MPKKYGKKQISPPIEDGKNENGSSAGAAVPAEGALAANFPPAPAGGGNLTQDDAAKAAVPAEGALAANFPPAQAGGGNLTQDDADNDWNALIEGNLVITPPQVEQHVPVAQSAKPNGPNFCEGCVKPHPEEPVKADDLAVARILACLIPLKPLFCKKKIGERKTYKGEPTTKLVFDTRFSVVSSFDQIVQNFLKLLGVETPKKSEKSTCASSGGGSAVFLKMNPKTTPTNEKKKEELSLVKSRRDIILSIFGSDSLLISEVFSTVDEKKYESAITTKIMDSISSFLSAPTWEGFIALFAQSGGKATQRYEKNLMVFKCLLSQHFSKIKGEDARFLAKMRLFLDIMSSLTQTSLFDSSRTREFLYDLAFELLRKLGRDTKRVSFDDISSSHAAIVVLVFKELFEQYEEERDSTDNDTTLFRDMLVQLFRGITESFSSSNTFLIEDICFDDKKDLAKFRLELSSKSTGLSHNSPLRNDVDLNNFMLNPLKIWKMMVGRRGVFGWIADPGTGKSTVLLMLALLQAILSKANVFYIGPETATMKPEYVQTIIEVVCQFLEACGRERPVIRLNQFGVAKCEAGVVNLFMTHVVGKCWPLLSSVFQNTPSVVAVDDNTLLTPSQMKRLFSRFNVSQLHLCGSTIDLTGCENVIRIGGDVAASVSFCAPTFMDKSGICSISPDAYRHFLIYTRHLRVKWEKYLKDCGDVSMGFISFFRSHKEKLQAFYDIIRDFSGVDLIRFVDLVKLARLLHEGFPTFQVGKVYSVSELNRITILVRKFITILNRIGFIFKDERLQFPKDLSQVQREAECHKVIDAARNGKYAHIVLTKATNAYWLEDILVEESENAHKPVLSSAKGLSTSNSDDNDNTGSESDGNSSEDDSQTESSDAEENSSKKKLPKPNTGGKTNPKKKGKKKRKTTKPKPNPVAVDPLSVKNSFAEAAEFVQASAAATDAAEFVQADAADTAAADTAAAEFVQASAADAADTKQLLSADDAVDFEPNGSKRPTDVLKNLTLEMILDRIFDATVSVGHRSLPKRNNVIEALSILCKCGHPDSARWLKSFIYGVVLLDGIMPTQFIELCLEMFDAGRMILILAYEMFHLQSWNSKCCQKMKVIVANSVPLWHLRQTMARAGRLGTEHSGEISSWVSNLVLSESDVSTSCVSVAEQKMPLMIENGGDICPIERAIMAMLCRGDFSRKHHDFVLEFLRIFRFVYLDKVCVHAFKGGRDYFMDFMKFISGVLVSKFVSPFECTLKNLEDLMCSLAFTRFHHGHVDDVEKTRAAFSNAMLGLVGPDSASMSLCLARAVGAARRFVGISLFDLPQLFKDLYSGYPDSLTSFLKLIRNLLINLQTMPMCKCDSTVDATVSAMLLVVTTTLDFVGDILSLLADTLRERDMERFRVGFVQEVSPLEQLHKLLKQKAGLPTLQDFSAFVRAHSVLKELDNSLTDVCNFLNPNPSGPFYDMQQKCEKLKNAICAKKDEKKKVELSKAMPVGMKPPQWVDYKKTDEFKALSVQVDTVQLPQLAAEIRYLEDELASFEKVLGNLPTNLSEVVGYFAKKI
jgi:hypothetical protein